MATSTQVGYAVVGLGHIAVGAVLPAFRHSKRAMLIAAPDKEIIFAATGVTEGTHSLVLTLGTREARFIDSVRLSRRPDVKVRF